MFVFFRLNISASTKLNSHDYLLRLVNVSKTQFHSLEFVVTFLNCDNELLNVQIQMFI